MIFCHDLTCCDADCWQLLPSAAAACPERQTRSICRFSPALALRITWVFQYQQTAQTLNKAYIFIVFFLQFMAASMARRLYAWNALISEQKQARFRRKAEQKEQKAYSTEYSYFILSPADSLSSSSSSCSRGERSRFGSILHRRLATPPPRQQYSTWQQYSTVHDVARTSTCRRIDGLALRNSNVRVVLMKSSRTPKMMLVQYPGTFIRKGWQTKLQFKLAWATTQRGMKSVDIPPHVVKLKPTQWLAKAHSFSNHG